jgi:uncharacterized protein YkwD
VNSLIWVAPAAAVTDSASDLDPGAVPLPVPLPIPAPAPVTVGIATADCPLSEMQAAQLSEPQYRQAVLCLINRQRSNAGRRPVRHDGRLRRAALRHSNAMVSHGFFSHTTPSGRGVVQRIRAAGYLRGAEDWYVGENLAWGQGRMSSPAVTVDNWINSEAHRLNLLRASYTEVGIGIARGTPAAAGDSTGVTVTTDYGRRD